MSQMVWVEHLVVWVADLKFNVTKSWPTCAATYCDFRWIQKIYCRLVSKISANIVQSSSDLNSQKHVTITALTSLPGIIYNPWGFIRVAPPNRARVASNGLMFCLGRHGHFRSGPDQRELPSCIGVRNWLTRWWTKRRWIWRWSRRWSRRWTKRWSLQIWSGIQGAS